MATLVHTRSATIPDVVRQGAWFVFGSALAFAIPYVGVSQLHLQHDVYYGVYFTVTLALVGTYARAEQVDVRALFTRHWLSSLIIGIPVAAFVVWNVVRSDDATSRPHGAYFAFELLWRGVGYGTVDALPLTVFPCVVAYTVLHGRMTTMFRRARFIAVALPMVSSSPRRTTSDTRSTARTASRSRRSGTRSSRFRCSPRRTRSGRSARTSRCT